MDLKQGMEVLRENKTFRAILSTLLSIGIFLNGAEVSSFRCPFLFHFFFTLVVILQICVVPG